MRLAIAPGSGGHYRIDREGRIYTMSSFYLDPENVRGPRPGERPPPYPHANSLGGSYGQVAGATRFWLPTGQVEAAPPADLFDAEPDDQDDAATVFILGESDDHHEAVFTSLEDARAWAAAKGIELGGDNSWWIEDVPLDPAPGVGA